MRKNLLTGLAMMCIVVTVQAQLKTGSVSGKITTNDGKSASDVTILIKENSRGAVSDRNGNFAIKKLSPGDYLLEISLVGFATITREVSLSNAEQRIENFQLAVSAAELEEVIIRSGISGKSIDEPSPGLRLTTKITEIPQNIKVVTNETIRQQQIFDISEGVTRNVAGANYSAVENWGQYSNITMRGGVVTAFRNGMNVKTPWGPLLEDMSMVERIEFVKGPASFLLANGEPTGLYNIVTKKPTGINRGEVGFALGSFDNYRTTLDLDGKLSEDGKLLFRLNLMGQMKNYHRDFDFNNRYSIFPVVTYRLNEKTSITAEYSYQRMKMAMLGSAYVFSPKMGELPRSFSNLESNIEPTNINDHSLNRFI